METALTLAQIVFYFTVSGMIIMIGVLCFIIGRHLVRIARSIEALSQNLDHASSEAGERLRDALDALSDLPILSYIFKKRPVAQEEKGRKGSHKK